MTPLPRNVTLEEEVVFQCQHSTADVIGWRLNGTLLSAYAHQNTTVSSIPLSDGGITYKLMIIALPEYNNTSIECVAVFLDPGLPIMETAPIVLLIQG